MTLDAWDGEVRGQGEWLPPCKRAEVELLPVNLRELAISGKLWLQEARLLLFHSYLHQADVLYNFQETRIGVPSRLEAPVLRPCRFQCPAIQVQWILV